MPRVKALKKVKSYRYNVNRKRVAKQIRSVGVIQCPEMRKAWSDRKTMTRNLYDMGLASDANKVLNIKTSKEQRLEIVKLSNGFVETDHDDTGNPKKLAPVRSKKYVVDDLETKANTFQESEFRLPKGIVKFAGYLIEKYGLNYKAMERDEKNYDQETWRQLRSKVRKFIGIPEQFDVWAKKSNIEVEQLDMKEYCTDDD